MNFLLTYLSSIFKVEIVTRMEGILMYTDDVEGGTLEEYRQLEMQLHLELMNACRKYISKLGIVSIIGILDIIKQETIELERATKKTFKKEELQTNNNISEMNPFSEQ
jgi:hypothetical protein